MSGVVLITLSQSVLRVPLTTWSLSFGAMTRNSIAWRTPREAQHAVGAGRLHRPLRRQGSPADAAAVRGLAALSAQPACMVGTARLSRCASATPLAPRRGSDL